MGLLGKRLGTRSGLPVIDLPEPVTTGGLPLMDALQRRQSKRQFRPSPLSHQTVSNLLWAAFGVNRAKSNGRTAPSALNDQEIDIYLLQASGAYQYEPFSHTLHLVVADDIRKEAAHQDFEDRAPLDLVYVANLKRMALVARSKRTMYAAACAGAIAQNVYLYCASTDLATVIRAFIARQRLGKVLDLRSHERVLFAQTVGLSPTTSEG